MENIKKNSRELKPKRKYRKRIIMMSDPTVAEVSIQESTSISEPYLGEEGETKLFDYRDRILNHISKLKWSYQQVFVV